MQEEHKTDDEEIREIGFTESPKNVGGITLRPVTVLSMSWLQRNRVFSDDGDMLQKTAAFVFLHSSEKVEIQSVVNNRSAFYDRVDEWIEANAAHHTFLEPYAELMNEALQHYLTASTRPLNPSGNGPAAKN